MTNEFLEKLAAMVTKAKDQNICGRGEDAEEATKNAFIVPFLTLLGWDVSDTNEVRPQYGADDSRNRKRGQEKKVDYAIFVDGEARIFIEAKTLGSKLDRVESQLKGYFNNADDDVRLGVLTNGLEYRLFTDIEKRNRMDKKPFAVFHLDHMDEEASEAVRILFKNHFNPEKINSIAEDLHYSTSIAHFLSRELDANREPSDYLVDWILRAECVSYPSRICKTVIERFRPTVQKALRKIVSSQCQFSATSDDIRKSSPSSAVSPTAEKISPEKPGEFAYEIVFIKTSVRGGADASGRLLKDGRFVVFKGSLICSEATQTAPNYRHIHQGRIGTDNRLTEDLIFDAPSTAASFVTYRSSNGWAVWKTASGTPLDSYRAGKH